MTLCFAGETLCGFVGQVDRGVADSDSRTKGSVGKPEKEVHSYQQLLPHARVS